jgi:dynein heavy chain 2
MRCCCRPCQAALKEGAPHLEFMGARVAINAGAGLFVTLNPAGKGYGGRSKLPDNLAQMFRCACGGP